MSLSHSRYCPLNSRSRSWRPGGDILYVATTYGCVWSEAKVPHRQRDSSEIRWVTANPPMVYSNGSMVLPVWAEFPNGGFSRDNPSIS